MKRMTKQHEAILNCILQENRPLSVEEILRLVKKEIETINLSTIYRNLRSLIEEGIILSVEIPGEKIRYEKVEKGHHHHFLCNSCNKVFNIAQCPKDISNLVPKGFSLVGHSITLNGYCIDCN